MKHAGCWAQGRIRAVRLVMERARIACILGLFGCQSAESGDTAVARSLPQRPSSQEGERCTSNANGLELK